MLHVIDHPLIKVKLTTLRNKETTSKEIRQTITSIVNLMSFYIMKELETDTVKIETPVQKTEGHQIKDDTVTFVPILRAGLTMVEGFSNLIPNAKIGHIGIYRDEETLEPVEYLCKLPSTINEPETLTYILDPMLATGGSAVKTIDILKENGAKHINLVCLVGCPEGVKAVQEAHPEITIFLAAMDEGLNEHGYIYPGLGDAGDRAFGTY